MVEMRCVRWRRGIVRVSEERGVDRSSDGDGSGKDADEGGW